MNYLVHQWLRTSAARYPTHVAVEDRERTLTYRELDELSDRLANLLISLGVRRGDRVGFYLEKSIESVLAIYGILKAGAAYVPFDPHAPAARLAYIARNAGLRVLITGIEKQGSWAELLA